MSREPVVTINMDRGIYDAFDKVFREEFANVIKELNLKRVEGTDVYIYSDNSGELLFIRIDRDGDGYCVRVREPKVSMFRGSYANLCVANILGLELTKTFAIHIVDNKRDYEAWKTFIDVVSKISGAVERAVYRVKEGMKINVVKSE